METAANTQATQISTSKLYNAYMESEKSVIEENHTIDFGCFGRVKSYRDYFEYICNIYLNLILHAGYSEDEALALIEKNRFNPFAM